MSKAVLVIDMPNRCSECPLCSKDENCWGDVVSAECQMQYKGYLANDLIKPNWCPLKILPQKTYAEFPDSYKYGFADGWNKCLEEIRK